MLKSLPAALKIFRKAENDRTLNIKKNVVFTFLIKGSSILIGFVLFRIAVQYVNQVQYGIWLNIASLVAWMNNFDVGLSNGLRNKIAGSRALNESADIAKYVSSTYAVLFFIGIATFGTFSIVGSFFNWNELFNVQKPVNYDIWPLIIMALGFFCFQFLLQPINSILIATHQPFKSSLLLFCGQLLTLVLTFMLTRFTHGSLFNLVLVVAGSPVIVLLCASFYFFKTSLKPFSPAFKLINIKSAKGLINLGGAFFFIQLGALVLYETDNIIITRTLGPSFVTTFNIAYKYFSVLLIAFTIIITPYWSAFTDAYAKNDFAWIGRSLKKLRLIWVCTSVVALLLYFFSGLFYKLWMGNKIAVPTSLSLALAFYVIMANYTVIHAYMLNGIGKLRVQLILVIGTSFLNIPLSVILIHKVALQGTVISNIVMMAIINIFLTYQCKLIIDKKAAGIWNR
jgi:O-antigen/teichoic acid export membrane protein